MTRLLLSSNTDWYLYNFRLALAEYIRSQGWEVVLASPPGSYSAMLEQRGFRWIPWQLGRKSLSPWQESRSLLEIASLYRRERPDIVHHHTIKPVLYGSLAARFVGVPATANSITGRGYIFLGDGLKARLLKSLVLPIYRMALNSSSCGVIFENDHDRQYFIEQQLIPAERAWLIAGVGVDPERFKPLPEPPGVPVVAMAARMLWDKGVGVLVEAARLLKKDTQVRLALIGEPDPGNPATVDRQTLEKWHAEGIIEWWGWQPEMPEAYNKSHIVTLPTMYGEGVPTSLIEAAACGRPLVATDIPGCRDVVLDGENGFLVPPGDPQSLALAIKRLVSDPSLRGRMGAASRQLIMQKFTHSQVNAATLRVYQHILGMQN